MKKIIITILAAFMAFSTTAVASDAAAPAEQTSRPTKKKAEVKGVAFDVHLHCRSCVKKLQENLAFERGVKDLHICMEDQIVSIKYDVSKTSEETLKNAIVKLGVSVKGISQQGHRHDKK